MERTLIKNFAQLCEGETHNIDPESHFVGYSLDSRQIEPGQLFIAVQGKKTDGNLYASKAINTGAKVVLTETPFDGPHILVQNIIEAIAKYGQAKRAEYNGPVIGVTGSCGKTTTKEFIYAVLSPTYPTLKSPGNRNTEYTSPLLWLNRNLDHKAVIAELSMRGLGQIRYLSEIAKPNIGVLTMIGTTHVGAVGNRDDIAKAKLELFESLPDSAPAIYWAEDDYKLLIESKIKGKGYSFGYSDQADCTIIGYKALDWNRSLIRGKLFGQTFESEIPLIGRHQANNAAAAMIISHIFGIPAQEAADRLSQVSIPPNRMEVRDYKKATILLDAYNASFEGHIAAIKTLSEIPCQGKKLAILGEMADMADYSESFHRRIGKTLTEFPPDRALLYGPGMKYAYEEAITMGYPSKQIKYVSDRNDLHTFLDNSEKDDIILIKGNRSLELENLLEKN